MALGFQMGLHRRTREDYCACPPFPTCARRQCDSARGRIGTRCQALGFHLYVDWVFFFTPHVAEERRIAPLVDASDMKFDTVVCPTLNNWLAIFRMGGTWVCSGAMGVLQQGGILVVEHGGQ